MPHLSGNPDGHANLSETPCLNLNSLQSTMRILLAACSRRLPPRRLGLLKMPRRRAKGNMPKYAFPLCILCLCPAAAQAMGDLSNIFKPYVSDTVTYNDNLFYQNSLAKHATVLPPLSKGQAGLTLIKDDVMNQATAGSAINYTLGRQKFNLNLRVSDNRFANNKFLDHVSTNDRAAWQWQLGRQLSGDAGYTYTRAMGGFTNTTFFGLDIITGNNAFANLDYAWHPRWKVRAGLNWQDYQHGASQRKNLDQQTATALVSLNYATPSNNSLGLQYSFVDGKYPNRELVASRAFDNKYQQHSANTLLTWKITEKTSFNGTVGYTVRQYPDFSQRNFSGETWDLMLSWTPTAKVMLSLAGWRHLTNWADQTASYIVTEGFSVSPMWQPLPKLALTAKFTRQSLDYAGDPGLVIGFAPRKDTLLSGQVSLVYTPVPNAEITLGYQAGTRDTNRLLLDYAFNSVFSSVMLKF